MPVGMPVTLVPITTPLPALSLMVLPCGSVSSPVAPNTQVAVLLPVVATTVTSVPVPLPLIIGVSAGHVSIPFVPNVQVLVVVVVAVSM